MLWNVLSRRMPALLMTMSTRPKASSAVCTIASPPSGVATLLVSATATPPRSSISLAVVWAGPSLPPSPLTEPPRSLTTTWAPRDASSRACSRPSPPPAPVMIATLPSYPRSAMGGEGSVEAWLTAMSVYGGEREAPHGTGPSRRESRRRDGRPGAVTPTSGSHDGRIVAVGDVDGVAGVDRAEVIDLDGLVAGAGIHRHPHPLRRPGPLGPRPHAVVLARRHDASSWATAASASRRPGPSTAGTIARTLENVEGMSVEALEAGIHWTFETFPEYLDAVDAPPKRHQRRRHDRPHAAAALRPRRRGRASAPPPTTRSAQMRDLVAEALAAGAVGFATSQVAHPLRRRRPAGAQPAGRPERGVRDRQRAARRRPGRHPGRPRGRGCS